MMQWTSQPFALQPGQTAVLRQPQADAVRIQIYGEGAARDEFNGVDIAVEGCDIEHTQPDPGAPSDPLFASEAALNQDTATSVWQPMTDAEGEVKLGASRTSLQITSVPRAIRLRETGALGAGHTVYGLFRYGIRLA